MAEYVVKLADERGRIQEQVQIAGSAEELRSRFSQAGYYVYSVRPRGMRGVGGSRKKANLEAFIIFNQQFLTLIRAGLPVFCTNPRSMDEILQSILLVGGLLGAEAAARALVADMHDEINQVREFSTMWPDRPRVYFEEWDEPLIAGIRWVSEVIELAGGRDVFAELRDRRDPFAVEPGAGALERRHVATGRRQRETGRV